MALTDQIMAAVPWGRLADPGKASSMGEHYEPWFNDRLGRPMRSSIVVELLRRDGSGFPFARSLPNASTRWRDHLADM